MSFGHFFWRMEKMIAEEYEISTTIRHHGERGRDREHGLAAFLKEHLPETFGVATGEIFAAQEDIGSPQCDIILYNKLRFPIIGKSRSVQLVPIDAVLAVIEVKSSLNSTELKDAFAKFATIREIPRLVNHPILFIAFGYKLRASEDLCVKCVKDAWYSSPVDGDEYTVVALDTGVTATISDSKRVVFLRASGETRPDLYPGKIVHYSLALLFLGLLDTLKVTKIQEDVDYVNLLAPFRIVSP